jgi:hypothetical protein
MLVLGMVDAGVGMVAANSDGVVGGRGGRKRGGGDGGGVEISWLGDNDNKQTKKHTVVIGHGLLCVGTHVE